MIQKKVANPILRVSDVDTSDVILLGGTMQRPDKPDYFAN
jgi:hypothetical protein